MLDCYYKKDGSFLQGEDAKRASNVRAELELEKLDKDFIWYSPSNPVLRVAWDKVKADLAYQRMMLSQAMRYAAFLASNN